ncbi:MAG: DUF6265 family protein, partial [Pseudomonadota bacterium]
PWRGGSETFVFEEFWWPADGGVMTGMARGVKDGDLAVLEYIIIEETEDAAMMRFKHFNADFSNWDGEADAPITLALTTLNGTDALFEAIEADAHVQSIRYYIGDEGDLYTDVKLLEDGEPGGFTLRFSRPQP